MSVAALTHEPDVVLPAQDGPSNDRTSTWEPVESGPQLSSAAPAATASIAPTKAKPQSLLASIPKLGLATGIAVAVLLAAGGVLAWHFYSNRGASSATKSSSELQQATATPPAVVPSATPAPGQTPKPTAGVQQQAASIPAKPQSESGVATSPHVSSTNPPPAVVQPPIAKNPPPTIAPPPSVPAPISGTPRSGTLHYQGPPVPYFGVVVFDNLPKVRLKFVFNHQGWSLTLKPNPDGTKKATLTSLVPGYQTSCDLSWEVLE
jgi:hypothetical protein